MHHQPSIFFRFFLLCLAALRRPYLWAKKKWPQLFIQETPKNLDLNTSRMLRRFNAIHQLFFQRSFDKIRFNESELNYLQSAQRQGPVVFMMRNWGQVEYNFFNHLFLKYKLPLVKYNNMVRMAHWMPWEEYSEIVQTKVDHYFQQKYWPYSNAPFDLHQTLQDQIPILFCLDLPRDTQWFEKTPSTTEDILSALMEIQKTIEKPIQLVPLHFIYDKHPDRVRRSLSDILLGPKEDPGYLRKMALFLRNFKKRAVAKIGEPIELSHFRHVQELSETLQKVFDQESRQVTGPRLRSRRQILSNILNDPKIEEKIKQLAEQENCSSEEGKKRTLKYLKEIASDIRFNLIEWWDLFLTWLFNTLFSGFEIDLQGLEAIKRTAKNAPIILVPCHKSHMDYLLLTYNFYHHDITLPYVCSGINLNFWPLGTLLRRSGAYFIRRSLPPDPFYGFALKSYISELMQSGHFQEFFIEGTRSRSGKLFPPKTGILNMMVESFLEGGGEDLYFVPVSLGYDKILEEGAYLKETQGGKKGKEGFADLLKLPQFLKGRYGKVYIQFADPISLKDYLAKSEGDIREKVQHLARKINISINEVMPLMPHSIVATVMLSHPEKSITLRESEQKSNELFQFAKQQGTPFSSQLEANPIEAIHQALEKFVKEGLVRSHFDFETRFFTIPEEVRTHLDFYKNQGIHPFAKLAIQQFCQSEAVANTLEDLLSREFFFSPIKIKAQDQAPLPWLHFLITPILEAYWLSLHVLEYLRFDKIETKHLIRKIQTMGETLKQRGTVKYSESLSRFTLHNALATFTEMEVLRNHVAEMGKSGANQLSLGPNVEKRQEILLLLEGLLEKPKTHQWIREVTRSAHS